MNAELCSITSVPSIFLGPDTALTLHTINGSLLNKIACHFHHAILVTMDTKR